ncbi:P2R1A-PPP2R2A-interacting phosphatase regulator 1 isoform X2 [Dermacentor variabilis]|uniref:P2R1A-PPP2R2A-interacting phosphatase regulator 1 isoform X2 n=1 Tax=Dermacentor variabilis TaxID=34621 RepID=UPI003F5C0E51
MDVDPPPPLGTGSNLKRSSSAPMINVLGNTPTFREALSPLVLSIPRTRRFSASFSPNHSPSSPLAAVPSRVSQIKHEEGMDVMIRETAHEKEVQSKLQISQSWDDLSLQCFSPSMCASSKQAFSPSPSPSPTRKAFATRSQSPITLRPSQFPVKRKFDMEMDQGDSLPVPSKRLNLSVGPHDMSVSHILHHSLSQSSLEAMSSPEQTVPQDMGDSLSSSSGSPGCPSVFHQHHPSSSSGVRSPLAPVVSIDSPCNMEDS